MKFVARLPKEGINTSRTHPLWDLTVLLAGVLVLGLGLFWLLSFALGQAVRLIPPEKEARLFSGFRDQVSKVFASASEPERVEELDGLLSDLVEEWPDAPYPFSITLIEEEDPNAAALPGGLILLTTGLLETVETENGLAFVLAHELGHYAQRDHLRGLSRGLALGTVVAVFTGAGSNAAPNVLQLTGEISNRRFSQRQESSADLFALELLEAHYGHVGGATEFFECILEAQGASSALLSTHPAPQQRVDRLEETIVSRGWATRETHVN